MFPSSIIQRVQRSIQINGLQGAINKGWGVATRALSHQFRRLGRRKLYRQRLIELETLIRAHHGVFDVLHLPMGWDTAMFQRHQHLSLQVAGHGGFALYGGNPAIDRDLYVYTLKDKNLCVFDATDAVVVEAIFEILGRTGQPVIIRIQSVDISTNLEQVYQFLDMGFYVLYEYIDLVSAEITGVLPAFVLARHTAMLKDERIFILATSDILLEDVRKYRAKNYILSTNGVDLAHWRIASPHVPADMQAILATGNPIVGYHGAMATWLDYDLLRSIAEIGRYELVLIGLEHDSALRESGLLAHPRVHFLGSKPYQHLNQYAAYYDVAILPFKKNELTDAVSPVKIFEYMAAGKPIVTTDLLECKKYQSCVLSDTADAFISNLQIALQLKHDAVYMAVLSAEAEANSWQAKLREIFTLLGMT